MPGVDAVLSVPYLSEVATGVLVGTLLAVLQLMKEVPHRDHPGRIAVAAVVLVASLVVGAAWVAPRWGEPLYDADATWRALESRYDVTLTRADKDATDLSSFRARKGTRSSVQQWALTGVRDASGGVRDDLFLQVRTSSPARLAVVTKPEGVSELIPAYDVWWPELPVVDAGATG